MRRRLAVALLSVLTAGCQDSVKPRPTEGGLDQITVAYLCGNRFELRNQDAPDKLVHYAVLGTAETGDVLLPAGMSTAPSITRLTAVNRGPLQISTSDGSTEPVENGAIACPAPAPRQPQSESGEWSLPVPWPVVAVHLHLLPTGRVLSWGRIGAPQVYNPADGSFSEVPTATMVFCSGHTFLADGRLLVSGGHLDDRRGLRDANLFDPESQSWLQLSSMSFARWYPTTTMLADGEVISLAGTDQSAEQVEIPEIWSGGSWRQLAGAARALPYYPRTFVAPNGLLFYAGELQQSAYLDPAGSGRWMPGPSSNYGRRDYGSAVMYQPGRVMILGGSDPPDGAPTNTAELVDLNEPQPSWRYTESMRYARRQFNATLLPDGQVLATGGTSAAGFSDPAGAVHAAELWSPARGQWRVLASNRTTRVYHSTSLLLPDGRVLHAGSGDGPGLPRELNAEIFSPPYLFRGPRPLLEEAPAQAGFGETFLVGSPDALRVVRVTLVRLGSVTHAFDQSQRFVELSFRRVAGGLSVQAPVNGATAPPGPYLLTLLDDAGVPSTSAIILIH
ncbi:MAG: galactose oxidase-like domain-containing protein [Gemmatimonadales bacterium]